MTDQLTTLAQRVKKLRLERDWSQAQLAEKIGANPSVIGNIERRNSKSTEYAEQLADVLEVDLAWLLTGKGAANKLDTQVADDSNSARENMSDYVVIGGSTDYPLVLVDYLDKKASCGGGYVNGEYEEKKGQIAFTVEFLRENKLPIDGDGLVLMHACGDSMGYTIPDETMMLVNRKECHFENMISKEVYTFNADGEMICKRAFKNLDGSITLVSDNTDKTRYPDQIVDKDKFNHFNIFGRVRYTFNKL